VPIDMGAALLEQEVSDAIWAGMAIRWRSSGIKRIAQARTAQRHPIPDCSKIQYDYAGIKSMNLVPGFRNHHKVG